VSMYHDGSRGLKDIICIVAPFKRPCKPVVVLTQERQVVVVVSMVLDPVPTLGLDMGMKEPIEASNPKVGNSAKAKTPIVAAFTDSH